MDLQPYLSACRLQKKMRKSFQISWTLFSTVPVWYFRSKAKPSPRWTARQWGTGVCSAPLSPWWGPRVRGVSTAVWWRGCTDRWASPRSASACTTPWNISTPAVQKVCDSILNQDVWVQACFFTSCVKKKKQRQVEWKRRTYKVVKQDRLRYQGENSSRALKVKFMFLFHEPGPCFCCTKVLFRASLQSSVWALLNLLEN